MKDKESAIILRLEKGTNLSKYGVNKQQLSDIRKNKAKKKKDLTGLIDIHIFD